MKSAAGFSRFFFLQSFFIHLRHYFPFYFVHKPLCTRHKKDSLQWSQVFFCRGCFFLYAGVVTSLSSLMLEWNEVPPAILNRVAPIGFLLIISASIPDIYQHWPRPVKDGLRFATGFLPVFLLILSVQSGWLMGLTTTMLIVLVWKIFNMRRAPLSASGCEGCEELDGGKVCSGYRLQAERIMKVENILSERAMYHLKPNTRTET